jgi:hypothetical protein
LLAALGLNVPAPAQGAPGGQVPQTAVAPQGAPSYQPAPAGQQNTTTPQQPGGPTGYQSVPVNPPAGATQNAAVAAATATPTPQATPIPNP